MGNPLSCAQGASDWGRFSHGVTGFGGKFLEPDLVVTHGIDSVMAGRRCRATSWAASTHARAPGRARLFRRRGARRPGGAQSRRSASRRCGSLRGRAIPPGCELSSLPPHRLLGRSQNRHLKSERVPVLGCAELPLARLAFDETDPAALLGSPHQQVRQPLLRNLPHEETPTLEHVNDFPLTAIPSGGGSHGFSSVNVSCGPMASGFRDSNLNSSLGSVGPPSVAHRTWPLCD